jgi:hypothetical protein
MVLTIQRIAWRPSMLAAEDCSLALRRTMWKRTVT